jgi:acyl-CoA dehydrogenase family protein 9
MSVYIDSGSEDYSVEAAISKVFASEALQRSADEALQIAAGNGFIGDYPYEQITRANEVLRLYIALSALKILRSCRNFYMGPRVLAHGQ